MKVHIIGLGPTAKDFKPDGSITIGVNDVHGCDYQVCVDKPAAFSNQRFAEICFIASFLTKKFYTHLNEYGCFHNSEIIKLKAVHAHNNRWNEFIPSSNNSPFVACGVAYKYFNANEIRLWGVDFLNHPNIKDGMRDAAVKDFVLLQQILNKKGCVIIPNKDSYLFNRI